MTFMFIVMNTIAAFVALFVAKLFFVSLLCNDEDEWKEFEMRDIIPLGIFLIPPIAFYILGFLAILAFLRFVIYLPLCKWAEKDSDFER